MMLQIIQWDQALFRQLNGLHHPAGDVFFLVVTNAGNLWVIIPLLMALFFFKIPSRRRRSAIIFALAGLAVCGITNTLLKVTVRRHRPVKIFAQTVSPGEKTVHVVGKPLQYRSFPSGHTTTAFAAATLVVMLWGMRFSFTYLLALLVAYSRVYMGVHFPLDTVVGALLGTCGMGIIMYFHNRKYGKAENNRI